MSLDATCHLHVLHVQDQGEQWFEARQVLLLARHLPLTWRSFTTDNKMQLKCKNPQKTIIGDVFESMQKRDSSTKGVLQLNDTSMLHITWFKDFADFARLRPNSLDLTPEDLKFNHVNLTCLTLAHCSPRETDWEKTFQPFSSFLHFSHFNRKCSIPNGVFVNGRLWSNRCANPQHLSTARENCRYRGSDKPSLRQLQLTP